MSRQVIDLENILRQMITEHQRLSGQLEAQQAAMKRIDMRGIDEAVRVLEATRLRIGALEAKRLALVTALARANNLPRNPLLSDLARLYPQQSASLLKVRAELRATLDAAHRRSFVAGKMAVAVLGHLNTVIRLLAKVCQQAGVYTKHGLPQVALRIGVMDAKG